MMINFSLAKQIIKNFKNDKNNKEDMLESIEPLIPNIESQSYTQNNSQSLTQMKIKEIQMKELNSENIFVNSVNNISASFPNTENNDNNSNGINSNIYYLDVNGNFNGSDDELNENEYNEKKNDKGKLSILFYVIIFYRKFQYLLY